MLKNVPFTHLAVPSVFRNRYNSLFLFYDNLESNMKVHLDEMLSFIHLISEYEQTKQSMTRKTMLLTAVT